MSIVHSPSIVTNGLKFYFDVNNFKSYAGPPIQNLMNQSAPVPTGTGTATGYSSVGGTEVVNIPTLGPRTVSYNLIQNNYTSFTPNSSNCCPCLMQYGNSITVSPNTLYTYAIVYKCETGYTNANYMYRYEYNSGTYVGESGVFNASNQIHLGSGWYWAWGTFTTAATTNTLINVSAFYYQYASTTDKLSVATTLLTPGNYTGLHPKYWPAMNTTRSATTALADLTGNYVMTVNSLTYSSAGVASFNGSNNIDINSSNMGISGNQPFTIESWTNLTSGSLGEIFGNYGSGYTSGNLWWATAGLFINGSVYHTNYATTMAGIHHAAVTRDGAGNVVLYRDGVQVATGTLTASVPTNVNFRIGTDVNGTGEAMNGNIYSVKVYNRVLSAIEIAQNFNAQRKIYGI